MYTTHAELKAQVRDLRSEILAVAKDLGGEIQSLYHRINYLQEIIETQQEVINKLNGNTN